MDNMETCAPLSTQVEAVSPKISSIDVEKKPNGTPANKSEKKSPVKTPPEYASKAAKAKGPKGGVTKAAGSLEAVVAAMSLEGQSAETPFEAALPTGPNPKAIRGISNPPNPKPSVPSPTSPSCAAAPKPPQTSQPATSCAATAKPIVSIPKQPSTSSVGKPYDKNTKRNREEKLRKKDDKSVEHVLKALSSLETTEEKLGAMCQKYAEIVNEHRLLQNAAKLCEKKNSILQREKEQLQADHSKAILTRSRLENLCRELQRQNKAVKEECMLKIREEEEKKRDVATKFQSTLTELGTLLAQNNDKNAKLRDDNLDMTTKLKSVCEQYERKEQHVEKLAKQMKLEMQLADAKLAKEKMERAMEKETQLREKQQLLLELSQAQTQMEEMRLSETALRNQIQLYNDKYDEFHKALLQSNEAIGGFKQEMERMSKQIRKLEKETVSWKTRYEAAHRTLLQMTEEKLKADNNAAAANRKLTALQGLCRSLQSQCTSLRNEVKGGGTNAPSRNEQEDELMNQVEKELSDNTTVTGLTSDNSPCPRQLSRESAEKVNGEVLLEGISLVDKEEPAEEISAPQDAAPQTSDKGEPSVTDDDATSVEISKPSPNGLLSPNGDIESDNCATPAASNKKSRAKKKGKK